MAAGQVHPAMDADLAADEHFRRTRAVCRALSAHEQELLLVLAALLRRAWFVSEPAGTEGTEQLAAGCAPAPAGSGAAACSAAQPQACCTSSNAEAEAAVRSMCGHFAGWLLGPVARASPAAGAAVADFLWFLVMDDEGYRWVAAFKTPKPTPSQFDAHTQRARGLLWRIANPITSH